MMIYHSFGHDQSPNCLQRLSADNLVTAIRGKVKGLFANSFNCFSL